MKIIAQKEKKKYLVDGELKNENVILSKRVYKLKTRSKFFLNFVLVVWSSRCLLSTESKML